MEIWKTILLALGGQAAMLAVLAYVGKSLFERLIVRDTKRFESELKAKSDAAIEHLRKELQLQTIEHQVRFSRLHDKRASVIAELYSHLVEALWEAESFLSPFERTVEGSVKPVKQEKYNKTMNKFVELYRYFDKNRIYLPEDICSSIEDLIKNVRSPVIDFGVRVTYEDHLVTGESQKEMLEAWNSGIKAFKDDVPVARRALENEFRSLLGVTTKTLQRTLEDSQR